MRLANFRSQSDGRWGCAPDTAIVMGKLVAQRQARDLFVHSLNIIQKIFVSEKMDIKLSQLC